MTRTMFFLPLIFSLITACTKDTVPVSNDGPVASTVNKTVLLQLVNNARKKGCNCGDSYYAPVPEVSWNPLLEKAAFNHSTDMFRNKYFSHTGSDGSGSGERITAAGYTWKFYGENIGAGYKTEKEVVDGWLNSPGHCRNIMNKNYREMAVARVGDYWTEEFGSR